MSWVPARRPLRTRLIASAVALLAVLCALIVVLSEFALSTFLHRQLDAQLAEASDRAWAFAEGPPPVPGAGPDPLNAPGQAAGTLNARFAVGTVPDAATLSDTGQRAPLSAADLDLLRGLPADARPHTATLDSAGAYRLTAVRTSAGVVVTGLPLAPLRETLRTAGLVLGGVGAAAVLGAGVAVAFAVRRTLRPLDRVAATAALVTELPLDRGEVALAVRVPRADTDPGTEIGQVGAALNRMLSHVGTALEARHAGELRTRRFVADASHELRTPLAAIRGYAELARLGEHRLPPRVAHAVGRVESEADRMAELVDGLLLLARLDIGRPLDTAEVDLCVLAADAVADAHISGPGHRWLIDLPPRPVHVPGDAQRLHQVLANLLSNGRTHTPPGTTVRTSLGHSADGSAVLTVTDDGPGIPAALLPSVFERFAGTGSTGTTGLGLAIADAIVRAHHGRIEVHSRPGRTEFEVRLPAAPQEGHREGTRAA
ncbi:sensor histidine kinase [Amycolatopsis nigrescens]|uniref:sensor histidine kinase n=1 Tax=Amycolatopsis nigrescens TaxID=381445 RepID=UPI00058CE2AA|nr:HAMP domain-containing sensor histidine kinase [Amycolatopsis nigrescens]